eukprot:TRINITY_DN2017_c0_g4_i3.p1 TRINITY_DN2017_c0_g4~~TRINITY_DN2017_c0_g4_i3.p1  ORF type:complete len:138 (+),score=17.16 TRINITY_DN2017_c0_g4_i3:690-1103(+)
MPFQLTIALSQSGNFHLQIKHFPLPVRSALASRFTISNQPDKQLATDLGCSHFSSAVGGNRRLLFVLCCSASTAVSVSLTLADVVAENILPNCLSKSHELREYSSSLSILLPTFWGTENDGLSLLCFQIVANRAVMS